MPMKTGDMAMREWRESERRKREAEQNTPRCKTCGQYLDEGETHCYECLKAVEGSENLIPPSGAENSRLQSNWSR